MHNNIAIELLKTFSKEEYKKFELFINSPFFNSNNTIVRLYSIIKKYAPDFTHKSLEREAIFKKIFPGKEYNELSLRSRFSELSDLLRRYMSIVQLEQNQFEMKFNFSKQMNSRGKYKIAEKTLLELINENMNNEAAGPPVYLQRAELVNELMASYRADEYGKDSSAKLIELGDALINYFYGYFFQIANDMLYNEEIFKYKPDFNIVKEYVNAFDFDKFLSRLEKFKYGNQPVLEIYYRMYMSRLDKENPEHFYRLKELTFIHYEKFDRVGLFNLWVFLSNAVTANLQFVDTKFNYEIFEVNKFFVNLKLLPLYPGGYFFQSTFDNIFINAIYCKEISYAENFVKNNIDLLPPDIKENMQFYCSAIIELKKENYQKSLHYLSRLKLNDIVLKTRVRIYYFINYYETDAVESALSLVDSFKNFLRSNKKIPDYLMQRVQSSLRYCEYLINAKANGKKLDYTIYKEAKENKSGYWSKEWILEKMQELL